MGIALTYDMPVAELRRVWGILDGVLSGSEWRLIFIPSRLQAFHQSIQETIDNGRL